MKQQEYGRVLTATGTTLGWFALIAQFVLIIINRKAPIPETIVRYFSFFTILSNIMAAVCFTSTLLRDRAQKPGFFSKPVVVSAVTLYILTTGMVYNIILRPLSDLQGFRLVVDEILHSAIPFLFVLYWILYVPKASLVWKNVGHWVIFPLLYCTYSLLRGAVVDYYPYPFLNVSQLGYQQVLLNCSGLVIIFAVSATIMVGISRSITRKGTGTT